MKNTDLLKWTFVNALGLGIGFLVCLQLMMIFAYGFDTEKYWQWIPPQQNFMSYFGILMGALVGGFIFGYAQSRIITKTGIKSASWILATVIGFGLLVLIDWPLLYTGDLGTIPGPVEPLIFTVGGCIFAGFIQFLFLRKQHVKAKRWLLMWIVGLAISVLVTALFFTFIGDKIGLSWPFETFCSGFIIAGVAALISGKTLFKVLPKH
jgi:hypothetical protein